MLADKINEYFGKRFSLSGAYAVLHRLGFAPLRPRPIHRKADLAAQEAFKKSAPLLRTRSVATTAAGSSRSGSKTKRGLASPRNQQGTLTHGWSRKGTRLRAIKQTEYDWSYVHAAVCPATGESSAMILPQVGIAAMNQHLKWISEHARSTLAGEMVKTVLLLDQAGGTRRRGWSGRRTSRRCSCRRTRRS